MSEIQVSCVHEWEEWHEDVRCVKCGVIVATMFGDDERESDLLSPIVVYGDYEREADEYWDDEDEYDDADYLDEWDDPNDWDDVDEIEYDEVSDDDWDDIA